MKIIINILKETFNFFCGDWRIFWGVAITLFALELIQHIDTLTFARPFMAIIFLIGLSLSLIVALKREITK